VRIDRKALCGEMRPYGTRVPLKKKIRYKPVVKNAGTPQFQGFGNSVLKEGGVKQQVKRNKKRT
jgi:hypothetical protein